MTGKNHKTLYVLEVSVFNLDDNFQIAKDFFKTNNRIKLIEKAQNCDCDILSLKFNINTAADIPRAKQILSELLPKVTKPLMISGINNENIDKELLPELTGIANRECIISFATENTYKEIIPAVIKGNHRLILRSPIDINLCKELNIMATELGLAPEKIIIDTDTGGLGYGLDYGYSTIEKVKLENDVYLNMPVISFVAEESLKTKEAKFETDIKSLGNLKTRAIMIETASASAVKAAGADIIVLHSPEIIKVMKGLDK